MMYPLHNVIFQTWRALQVLNTLEKKQSSDQSFFKREIGIESRRGAEKDEGIERVQKLEETLQFRYAELLGQNLPEVTLHRGGSVQEELREMGAVAAAWGTDVYIREEAYQEGTTATDAIILHELTHVLQSQENKRIQSREERLEAEIEAERNEALAAPVENGYYYAKIGDHLVYINDKIAKAAIEYATKLMKERVNQAVRDGDIALLAKIERVVRGRI